MTAAGEIGGNKIDRRVVLGLGLGAAALGLGGALMSRRKTTSGPVELVIGTNGGLEYETMYRHAYARFEAEHNVKIQPVFGDGPSLLNRVIAERDNPTLDAVVTYQGGWLLGRAQGVFEKVDYANIPYINDVYPMLHDPEGYAPLSNISGWGLAYHRDAVPTPPTSLKDLWKAGYSRQLMIGGVNHCALHIAAFAECWGGSQDAEDVAFAKLRELAPSVTALYGLASDAQSKFQEGVAQIATWYSFTAQRLRQKGIPIDFRVPEEGIFLQASSFQAVKGTRKLDLVEKFLGLFYDPNVAPVLARENGYVPANRNVKLDPELQREILTYDQVNSAKIWDWKLIQSRQAAWLDRWNSEIRPLIRP